ncbi:MAG TPA: diaminopimelate decarboxylase [Pyrinomonadaceae bacterium]|nr:diaminopimelate decarboxylase [Chloracidobacterium sp.]HBE81297.1 diaminopimelate decarboxylase [Blastocatellia bacterium]HRJ87174.1 diaminopimelate decarboxylase [Pyrinomonadaceae bacterium]HRK49557.1 diaminopimelate decarboxylase [Pyrinomonadaceae bacterium]
MSHAWVIPHFLEIQNNRLNIDGVDAVELALEHGTPLFIYSENRIRHNVERLKKAASVIDRPLKLCYAAKAMSTLGILRAVKDAGSDIEVNSGGELWKALRVGFTGEQINYNGNSKEIWELELAISNDVYAIQVDSLYELSLIEETAKRIGKPANVSLRLVPEIKTGTHSGLQTALVTSKFGMMPDEAFTAFAQYKGSPHVNLNGIHLHIGSQLPESQAYVDAFRMLTDSMMRIFDATGITLKHINLGGGFPVNYLRDGSGASQFPAEQREMFSADFEPADAVGQAWTEARKFAADCGSSHLFDDLTLLLEPGRSIIADAGICLTSVRNNKERPVQQSEIANRKSQIANDTWLLTDAGFNILLSMETYKWYYHLISAERAGDAHDTPYKLAGPLCDGGDVYFDHEGHGRLPEHRLLPADMKPGDVLALLNCGAYSLAQASQYNGRFLPPVVLIKENGEPELVRRRETFDDLIASDL